METTELGCWRELFDPDSFFGIVAPEDIDRADSANYYRILNALGALWRAADECREWVNSECAADALYELDRISALLAIVEKETVTTIHGALIYKALHFKAQREGGFPQEIATYGAGR